MHIYETNFVFFERREENDHINTYNLFYGPHTSCHRTCASLVIPIQSIDGGIYLNYRDIQIKITNRNTDTKPVSAVLPSTPKGFKLFSVC